MGGVLLASAAVTPAQAVALGEVHVRSSLGEPLVAEVSLPAGDRGNLEVVPAPATAYSQHGLQVPERLGRITTTVVRTADGRQALRITSTGPVNDPIVDLLVQASDQSGRLERQLTLLVNPAQMGAGARQGGTVLPLRANRQPAGVAVQDGRSSAPARARHPVHKKKAPLKVRRKSKTAVVTAHKPAVAVAPSRVKLLPEVADDRALASAVAPAAGAKTTGATGTAAPHGGPTAVTDSLSSAVTGSAGAASGAAAPASGTAKAPAAGAAGAGAPRPSISVADAGVNSGKEASQDAEPESRSAAPVIPKTPAPAERAAGYERWGGPAALLALLLAGGLIWQRRRRQERLLDADDDDAPDDDLEPGKIAAARTAAVVRPVRPRAQGAAVASVAAGEPVREPLPDFSVTRAIPEDDPLVQAGVYLSAGNVDQARTALEEGLLLEGDHVAILQKLLSIHADQRDVSAFNESAARLAQETARARDAWRQACEIGHRLDPANVLYAGGAAVVVGSNAGADDASGGGPPLPGAALPEIAAVDPVAGSSPVEAVLPLALAPLKNENGDGFAVAVAPHVSHDDDSADASQQPPGTALTDTNPESERAESAGAENGQCTADAEHPQLADGIPAEPEVTAPVASQEASLQAAAAERDGEREDPLAQHGAADTGGFDRLPALLKQATQRADGGDRQGALELATEVARLLAALRNEALALVPNSYA